MAPREELLDCQDFSSPFWDDDDNVFEADISRLYDSGITAGCSLSNNDRFCPGGPRPDGGVPGAGIGSVEAPAGLLLLDVFVPYERRGGGQVKA